MNARGLAPLVWGEGPVLFEIFLEPTCPFSNKALKKLKPFLHAMGEGSVTVRVYLHVQPWHMFSAVITRAILAASLLPDGRDAAWKMLECVADHRDEFEFHHHSSGANMDATPHTILKRLENYSGFSLTDVFQDESVTSELKRHTRYSRQNGIHVSPTIMLNGLIDNRFSSDDTVEKWMSYCK
ncbi:thioredoxin [Saccharibacter sp. 17.LH.SD]|nr:thioredoxin [Saccharibacter sp. 17.LH.SD]